MRIQRADIYLGGQYAGWTVVATGKEGYDTPAGDYKILEKVVDKHSTLYGRTVDAEGKVTDCKPVDVEGARIFGEIVCKVLRERAKFEPSRTADGQPTTAYFLTPPVRFTLM